MILRKIKYLVIGVLIILSFDVSGQSSPDIFFKHADRFFRQNVKNGRLNYASIKSKPEKLNELIHLISATDLSNARSDTWKSFLINAYNLLVIKNVINHYPITSTNDIPGFFNEKIIKIGADSLSLKDLEENSLKSVFKDPKINFLLCNAQIGSPALRNFAYSPEMLVTQTIDQTIKTLNDTNFIKKDKNGTLLLAFLFFENKADFTLTNPNVQSFINKYRNEAIGNDSLFTFFQPDDGLNEIPVAVESDKKQESESGSVQNDSNQITSELIGDSVGNMIPDIIDLNSYQPKNLNSKTANTVYFFTTANRFFEKYVYEGKVDYTLLKKQSANLNNLLGLIPFIDLENERTDTRKAFWLNVYNLLVIKLVIDHYPVERTSQIPGFFDKKRFKIKGEEFSLNELEEKKLKSVFRDPRLNFALCKASLGSPPLLNEAYVPEILSTQLINQTVSIINDTNFIKSEKDGSYKLSELFEHNKNDFLLLNKDLQHFINRYRKTQLDNDSAFIFFSGNNFLNDDLHTIAFNEKPNNEEHQGSPNFVNQDIAAVTDDGLYPGISLTPKRQATIQLINNLLTYKEYYGRKLNRNTSRYSYASNNIQLQVLYGIGRKTTLGISLAGRTSRLGGTFESPVQVYNFHRDTNTVFYLRSISPFALFDISDGYIKVKMQTYFNIPVKRVKNLKYNGIRLIDENPYLLDAQLYFYRDVSEYVRLIFETDLMFKFDNQIKSFTFSPKAILGTLFHLPLTKRIQLFGIIESAPTGNLNTFLSAYYIKEGTGLKFNINKNEITIYYSYIFFGKNVNAFQSLVLNIRSGL